MQPYRQHNFALLLPHFSTPEETASVPVAKQQRQNESLPKDLRLAAKEAAIGEEGGKWGKTKRRALEGLCKGPLGENNLAIC